MFDTPDVKRQDCTVNYEWLSLPIPTDHPFYDQIVDFNEPSKTGSDVTEAIAARHVYDSGAGGCTVGSFSVGRRLPASNVKPDTSGAIPDQDLHYVLSAQCKEGGSIKWIDGPYDCTGSNCLREFIQIDRSWHLQDWQLCGLANRRFKTSGSELDRLGLCRIGNDDDGWTIGTLIRYRGGSTVQCCRQADDWNTPKGCSKNDGFDYSKLPYQMLWAGDCQ